MARHQKAERRLSAKQLAHFRERLNREHSRLVGLFQSTALDADRPPGMPDPHDVGDEANESTTSDIRIGLSEADERMLEQIDRALRRLELGTYGLSEVTGDPIPLARLEAVPWATTNVGDE
ncbi:MAG: TraR/DksA family transcriptional regulator [Myxococcaceae bacterium]